MYREMTDVEAVLGPYRATKCEWTHPDVCQAVVVPSKAYCEEHMKLAYKPNVPRTRKRK